MHSHEEAASTRSTAFAFLAPVLTSVQPGRLRANSRVLRKCSSASQLLPAALCHPQCLADPTLLPSLWAGSTTGAAGQGWQGTDTRINVCAGSPWPHWGPSPALL